MIKIGILGASDIAFRRMAPALCNSDRFQYVGVAISSKEEWGVDNADALVAAQMAKAKTFEEKFGGKIFESYHDLLTAKDVDAIYLPLPPGLHYKWGKIALENGKHILLEKPFTACLQDTESLLALAEEKGLAVHENFAFVYHAQIEKIKEIVDDGEIGDVRLIRTAFGFPYRGENDFRYHKSMGGGALLDCGGYPLKLADYLLGGDTRISDCQLLSAKGHDVDVYGAATLQNEVGAVAQIAFGMDNSYKCDLEIWGSQGYLSTPRVFTPTAEMETVITIKTQTEKTVTVAPDDQFLHSAEFFADCVGNALTRAGHYQTIRHQAKLFQDIINEKGV
ncbi:MAG: Gfo/Idh/MocA family oxidoreductase [Clostridiales bacterium]|nr:Gfo/Idh/MocA family oxidoreductase [Clostridiales bacterium]